MQKRTKNKTNTEFLSGPAIAEHDVSHCDAHRLLMIDSQVVKFSRIEYPIVLLILKRSNSFASFSQLIRAGYGSEVNANTIKLLRRRISSIRLKLWNLGIIIVAVNGCGYSYKLHTPGQEFDEQFTEDETGQGESSDQTRSSSPQPPIPLAGRR